LTRLRFLASVNPPTRDFETLSDDAEVTFVPLEDVWPPPRWRPTEKRRKKEVSSGYTRFREGDLLVPKITPTFEAGRSVLASGLPTRVAAGTTELHVVRARAADTRFLNYCFQSKPFLAGGEAAMVGVAGQKRVPEAWLLDHDVLIGDVASQREVADFLDAETARIDALIEKKRQLLNRISSRRHAAIGEAINSIEGDSLSLRRVVEAFIDYRGATPEKAESGVPLVTATNVSDGEIDLSLGEQFLAEEKYVEWMRRGFPEVGDVLLTTEAPLGEVAMITDARIALAQRIILLKPNRQRVEPRFLYASLRSPQVQADLLSRASGSTVSGIRADRLRDVRLCIPSLSDQQRVVRTSQRVEAEYLRGRRLLREQMDLLREHRQALITAAVTDQLDMAGTAA
jgi:type I restriction enzyme S subunit